MLSQQQLLATAANRRPLRSLRQQYDLYVMDRIEHFKNSVSRGELMRLADEAMADPGETMSESQLVLTEMVIQEAVDARIKKMLRIKSFESWRKYFPKLRAGQRDPIHWGMDAGHLVAGLAPRLEADDPVLVVGSGAEACAYLLAAHEACVTYLDRDFGVIERTEHRVAAESLSSTFQAICVQFGKWLPCVTPGFVLVVIDAGTLSSLSPGERRVLLSELQDLTAPGGLHALVPDSLGTGPEGFAGHYASWTREAMPPSGRRARGTSSRGALFVRPRNQSEKEMRDARA